MILDIILLIIKIVIVFGVLITIVAYITLAERRISGFVQDRLGPNRVGPEGFLQPLADGIKNFMKEDIIPDHVYKPFYVLAPFIIAVPALITFAVIPFGDVLPIFGRNVQLHLADIDVGLLFIFAVSSLGVFGIVLAGWSSNNKYSLLGGLRASAQMISYEVAMGLSVIGVLMISESLRLNQIVLSQAGLWNIIRQPIGFLVFVIAVMAETNRLPFDLPEAEPELVAGYHTEYSSMKFALFFIAEYANLVVGAALIVTLFLGGWLVPGLDTASFNPFIQGVISLVAFMVKLFVVIFVFIWIRWTLPRFRYDQLMNLGWKVFLPLALFNIFITGLVMVL